MNVDNRKIRTGVQNNPAFSTNSAVSSGEIEFTERNKCIRSEVIAVRFGDDNNVRVVAVDESRQFVNFVANRLGVE